MSTRPTLDSVYMQNALNWASRSKAIRKKTGAVIVKDCQTISDGYNGMPANSPDDCCELKDADGNIIVDPATLIPLYTHPLVLHAEANAILKLAANGGSGTKGATLYCTMSPCVECTKLILQAKIARVVYYEEYRNPEGIEMLRSYGVIVEKYEGELPCIKT